MQIPWQGEFVSFIFILMKFKLGNNKLKLAKLHIAVMFVNCSNVFVNTLCLLCISISQYVLCIISRSRWHSPLTGLWENKKYRLCADGETTSVMQQIYTCRFLHQWCKASHHTSSSHPTLPYYRVFELWWWWCHNLVKHNRENMYFMPCKCLKTFVHQVTTMFLSFLYTK